MPDVVGEYETTTSTVEVAANVAGPVNPAGYVISPVNSPKPLFVIVMVSVLHSPTTVAGYKRLSAKSPSVAETGIGSIAKSSIRT